MWLASQFVPLAGSVSGVPTGSPVPPPVSEANQEKGKCLATYWSEYWGSLLVGPVPLTREAEVRALTSAGKVEVSLMSVGFVTGLLLDEPGAPHAPSSRPGTLSDTNEVDPMGWAPPRSWA